MKELMTILLKADRALYLGDKDRAHLWIVDAVRKLRELANGG